MVGNAAPHNASTNDYGMCAVTHFSFLLWLNLKNIFSIDQHE
jgi:hypothetical protein